MYFTLFLLLFLLLLGRFFWLQVTGSVDGVDLTKKAEERYKRTVNIDATRGGIYDRNEEAIAKDTSSYTLKAVLDKSLKQGKKVFYVVDPQKTAEKIAPLIGMDVSEMVRRLSQPLKEVVFGTKGRGINYELKAKIDSLKLPGIIFDRSMKRFYPDGVFASHVIGYTQYDEDAKKEIGMMGLEKSLNDQLTEHSGEVTFQGTGKTFMFPGGEPKTIAPKNGNEVYLTTDEKIQTFAEDAMNTVDKKYKPESMICIVMNPKTGEVLAMSTRPSFNPNKRDITYYLNDAMYDFEPGSTMKIFTLAAAINEHKFNPNATFMSGSYMVFDDKISDHNKVGWGRISFLEAVQRSSNVGFANLAEHYLGFPKLREYLDRFHFNQPTGIDLPGEKKGTILYKNKLEKVTTSFGQGTTLNPLQQVQAATAVANGGKMMKPYIVKKIVDPNTIDPKTNKPKVVLENKPVVVGQPIRKDTAEQVLNILETVVTSPKGTGRPFRIEGYDVAGKTGTAQMPNLHGVGYLKGDQNHIFSFLGFAPKDNPSLIVYVAIKKPKIAQHEPGWMPVSQVFNNVMKNSLQYLNIQPTAEDQVEKKFDYEIAVADVTGQLKNKAKEAITKQKLMPVILGNGETIASQYPREGEKLLAGERVILLTSGKGKMPDITGWSLHDVMKIVEVAKLKPSITGAGYVVKQNIAPGSELSEGNYLIVELKKTEPIVNEDATTEEKKTGGQKTEEIPIPLE